MIRLVLLTAAMAAVAIPAQANDPVPAQNSTLGAEADKIICKRELEPGSVIKRKKRCFTKAEWDRIAQAARAGAQHLIDANTSRSRTP